MGVLPIMQQTNDLKISDGEIEMKSSAVQTAGTVKTSFKRETKKVKMIWHYTIGESFAAIRRDGLILPADECIAMGELPIVWFSKEQFWEPTVTKAPLLSDGTSEVLGMDGLFKHGILLIRIGVDSATAPYTWSEMKESSGMPPQIARGLASVGRRQGANPSRWRGTFEAVSSDKWKAVEFFTGLDWVPLEA